MFEKISTLLFAISIPNLKIFDTGISNCPSVFLTFCLYVFGHLSSSKLIFLITFVYLSFLYWAVLGLWSLMV